MNLVRRSRSLLKGRGLVLCFALAAALLASAPAAAWAQTVSYMTPTVNRTPDGGTDVRTGNATTQYYISHDDCVNNQAFVFPLSVSTETGFVVYASSTADCSNTTSRGTLLSGGADGCVELPNRYNSVTGDFTINAQDLVYGVLQTDCDGNGVSGTTTVSSSSSSTSSGFGGGTTFSTSSSISSSGTIDAAGVPVTVFFTFSTNTDTSCLGSTTSTATSSGGTTGQMSGICASWGTQILLVPPAPPTGLSLGYGDGELIVQIPSTSAVNSSGGYYVFCAAQSGVSTSGSTSSSSSSGSTTSSSSSSSSSSTTSSSSSSSSSTTSSSTTSSSSTSTSATGTTSSSSSASSSSSTAAGTGGAFGVGGGSGFGGGSGLGGAGGSSSNANLCPAGTTFPIDISQPDVSSPTVTPYICAGPIQYSASTVSLQMLGNGKALQDNTQYIVGVSSYDEVYNIGPPSALMCGSPQQTNTFLKDYCSEGGPGCGGCGSCNVGSSNDPLWPMLGLAALGGVAVIVRRDRRRRRRRAGLG